MTDYPINLHWAEVCFSTSRSPEPTTGPGAERVFRDVCGDEQVKQAASPSSSWLPTAVGGKEESHVWEVSGAEKALKRKGSAGWMGAEALKGMESCILIPM